MHILLTLGVLWTSILGAVQEKPEAGLVAVEQDKPPAPKPPPPPPAEKIDPPKTEESIFKTLVKQFSIGGQVRIRAEYRDPTSYSNAAAPPGYKSDDFIIQRIRLNLKFSVTDDIEVFLQPQDQRIWGQETSVLTDERALDLHQGFVEIRNLFSEPLSIKAGRFEMAYGDQRLVSPLDWHNVARAWDGAKLRYATPEFWIEGFYTVIRDPYPATLPTPFVPVPGATGANGAAEDQDFMGVYFSYVGIAEHEFDAYAFFREFQDNTFIDEFGNPGSLIDHTVGARIKGKDFGFDYTLEVMGQGGHLNADRIAAYAYAATLGYTFSEMAWKPRIGFEYAYASGDRTPGNGTRQTFDPLFPFFHYYQGYADVFGFKNSKSLSAYIKVAPADNLTLHVDLFAFQLAQARDSWFNDPGASLRRDVTGGSSRKIGTEVDLHAKYNIGKNVKIWGGWSHFIAGEFVRKTATIGETKDMNWFFLQLTVDF